VKGYCGPYFIYTATGAWTVEPYTKNQQPLDSSWAAAAIKRWRRRIASRRASR